MFFRRFPLHGRGGLVKQKRFTPLGNPRDYDAANVHVFTGNRTTVKGRLGTRECVFDLKLRTIHVFAAARENADRHSGRTEPQWELLGWKLEELLAKDLPRRAASRDKIFQDV